MRQHGKLGALPRDMKRLAPELADYLTSADPLPRNPAVVDRASRAGSWPMYLNDQIGDCTVAAMAHIFEAMTAFNGSTNWAAFADDEIQKVYSAVSGYVPGDPNTDNGATLADVCNYAVKTGFTDVNGKVHKLAAWAEISNFKDLRLLKRIANAFGAVYLAINCPQSAQDQFNAGHPWSYVPGSPIEGGHAINLQWSAVNTGMFHAEKVVTWGALQPVDVAFFEHYLIEAVAVVSADDDNAVSGHNPAGLNLQQMIADCQTKFLV